MMSLGAGATTDLSAPRPASRMCGRYTLTTPDELIAEAFGMAETELPELAARYNIAPSQDVAAVDRPAGSNRLRMLRWGLVARELDDDGDARSPLLINARAETVASKPAFRDSFRSRRCAIPADGFYEWRRSGSRREPFHIRRKDRALFAFAGIWREADGDAPAGCAILTTEPNELMRGIHDRMPVLLRPDAVRGWIDPAPADLGTLRALLAPFPAEAMEAVRVGSYVNAASAEGPRCLEPERQKSLFD